MCDAYHDAIDALVVVRLDDSLLDALTLRKRGIRCSANLLQDKLDAEFIALLLQLQRFVHVQRVRVNDGLLSVVYSELLVDLLRPGRIDEGIPGVLAQTYPMLSEVLVGEEVLRRGYQLRSGPHYRVCGLTL